MIFYNTKTKKRVLTCEKIKMFHKLMIIIKKKWMKL